ncbi:hypothetical protein S7711_09874, partial [Stachybotrys chartarum IBT 7711]
MKGLLTLSSLALVARPVIAWQYISPDALPAELLSTNCRDALTVVLDCPRQVGSFFEREKTPLASLQEACTTACDSSLADFEASLTAECGEDDIVEYTPGAEPVHISIIAQDLYYHFQRTCIKDGERFCNIWAFENSPDNESSASATATASVNLCDNCVIKPFQFLAGTSYSNGFALQADYSTLTSSCSNTGFPLATTVTADPTTPPSAPTCAGEEYTIQAGDTCQSISEANEVGTAWMLLDNGLQAFCANFPEEGEKICIVNQCHTYVIQADDTCQGIAAANGISMVQLYTWNPVLGVSCIRMSLSVGHTVCLTPHDDEDYATVTRTTTTPTPAPTAAPVPSNIASGTNENCAEYYTVQVGNYCNQIIMSYSISLQDFLFLNSGLNAECTNLFAEEAYCVRPVGPINMYPGHPDYVEPTSTVPDIAWGDLPPATFSPPAITGLPTHLPRAQGTRRDCYIYMDGTELQYDMSWGSFLSACAEIAGVWEIALDELHNWNPSLDPTSTDCVFSEELSYCMAAYEKTNTYTGEPETTMTALPPPTTTSSTTAVEPSPTELPIRDGAAENCVRYFDVITGMTCQEVLDANGMIIAEFYALNPAVGDQCWYLWP